MKLVDRLRHNIRLRKSAYGVVNASIEFWRGSWVLKKGSTILEENPADTKYYNLKRDQTIQRAELAGYLVKNRVIKDLTFSSCSEANYFASASKGLRGVVLACDEFIRLEVVLQNPSIYNKYIAHCNYYDKDWNVIADSDRGQAESSISDSLNSAPQPLSEPPQPITQPQSLQDINTSDIINELASRIIDISKQWGG